MLRFQRPLLSESTAHSGSDYLATRVNMLPTKNQAKLLRYPVLRAMLYFMSEAAGFETFTTPVGKSMVVRQRVLLQSIATAAGLCGFDNNLSPLLKS